MPVGVSTTLTPAQRTARARLAALARWSREDPQPSAIRAQQGLRDKFLREVIREFPDLTGAELARRADVRYREHMQRLAFERSTTRSKRAADRLAKLGGDAA